MSAIGGLRSHFADGLFEREELFIANVMAEDAGKCAVRAGMGGGAGLACRGGR